MLLFEILIGLFQTCYDTLLFQTKLLHFGIVSRHLLQINLETSQIIMGLLIELVKLNILLLEVFSFPSSLFYLIQLIKQVLIFMLDPFQLPFDYDQFFDMVLQKSFALFLALNYKFASGCGS